MTESRKRLCANGQSEPSSTAFSNMSHALAASSARSASSVALDPRLRSEHGMVLPQPPYRLRLIDEDVDADNQSSGHPRQPRGRLDRWATLGKSVWLDGCRSLPRNLPGSLPLLTRRSATEWPSWRKSAMESERATAAANDAAKWTKRLVYVTSGLVAATFVLVLVTALIR